MIRLAAVTVRAGAFALADISLDIPAGAYGVLMGATGSGKTTLLEAVAGLRPVTAGTIRLNGRDVTALPPGARGVGFVPQDGALFRTMTVRQHLAFALTLRNTPPAAIAARVSELAEAFHLTHLLNRRPAGLSGGEAQRVALGRALSFHPPVLLLDEPLSAVDEPTRDGLIDILNALRATRTVTVLHITHSAAEAARLADVRYQLAAGAVRRIE